MRQHWPGCCAFLLKSTRHASLTIIPLFLCWGMISTIFNVVCQAETIQATKNKKHSIAMSIFSGIFNLGIGLGSFLGGQIILFTSVCHIWFARWMDCPCQWPILFMYGKKSFPIKKSTFVDS